MAVAAPPASPARLRDLGAAALVDLMARGGQGDLPERAVLVARLRGTGLLDGGWVRALREDRSVAAADDPLHTVAGALRLTLLEVLALALIMAVEEDVALSRAVAAVQAPVGNGRPNLGLLALLFGPLAGGETPLQELVGGRALASGLLHLGADDRPLSERAPQLRPALYLALSGRDSGWPGVTVGTAGDEEVVLAPSLLTEAERHAQALVRGQRALVLRSGSPAEGRAAAAALAALLGMRAAFYERDDLEGLVPWLLLGGLLPVFCGELAPGERKRLPDLPYYDGPLLALAGPDGSFHLAGQGIPDWVLGVPPRDEREQLWLSAVHDAGLARDLAREHRHASGRIAHLGRLVRHRLVLEGETRPRRDHVHEAAWVAEGHGLGGLAQPLRDPVPDEALVVDASLQRELDLLLLRCRARDGLSDGLGASAQVRYRPGVRTLFVGPSGTGKTLAAGWLATRLGLPLYRVDLAAVTSKYIGETEKNLALLLARAEYAEVVLLFDEADSMFGKRTDVKEANDRFANAQTNYLLQRIESFDGITILTSNSRSRFDSSFTRRLDAVLDFALPGPEERRGLWLSHLGSNHVVPPRALNKLAAILDLAGGHIRNAVFTAAVLAGDQARPIAYPDLLAGLVAELRKLGRHVPQELKTED